ncbi:MAG: hypothetical protein OEM81_11055, partial [Acidimicrobiia bacterium]|nr:hypothetical protein [Acidimicrobiia bacterium]
MAFEREGVGRAVELDSGGRWWDVAALSQKRSAAGWAVRGRCVTNVGAAVWARSHDRLPIRFLFFSAGRAGFLSRQLAMSR